LLRLFGPVALTAIGASPAMFSLVPFIEKSMNEVSWVREDLK
jgi:hypothetical protein